MAKDRLNELQLKGAKADDDKKNRKGSTENGEASEAPSKDKKGVRKAFERAEVLNQWIEAIEENTRLLRQHLSMTEDIRYNQKDIRAKIDDLFQKNTTVARQITNKLREFKAELKEGDKSAQGRIELIQYNSVKTRFQKAFHNSNTELENYKTIQREILKAHLRAKGEFNVTDEELTSLIDEGKEVQVFTQNILSETAEAKRMLADIEERHDHLLKIEQMLTEVRDLFLQLAVLVDTQRDLVDRVEYQATTASAHIRGGIIELDGANKKKRKYLKKKICCATIIAVIIVIIIVAFVVPK